MNEKPHVVRSSEPEVGAARNAEERRVAEVARASTVAAATAASFSSAAFRSVSSANAFSSPASRACLSFGILPGGPPRQLDGSSTRILDHFNSAAYQHQWPGGPSCLHRRAFSSLRRTESGYVISTFQRSDGRCSRQDSHTCATQLPHCQLGSHDLLQYARRFWLRDFVGETASRRHDLRVDRRRARENGRHFREVARS